MFTLPLGVIWRRSKRRK
ncbi:hypothetical protein ZEAMMB73_Zm00001d040117 [Zea mays]|uniref:Uncharacterized protein n=2 Tax=Zea mays TaxID=4577 RepID=A0A1D6MN56_MAIZE|nr:hypothetical protein ZEAMMB73_Zm00001d040117 [Zea mays]